MDLNEALTKWHRENDLEGAKTLVRDLTRIIGPGFHPDTDINDYVNGDGTPTFETDLANELQLALTDASAVMEKANIDPCDECWPVVCDYWGWDQAF